MIVLIFIYKLVASAILLVLGCCAAYLSGKYTFKLFDYFLSIRDVVRMSQYDYDRSKFVKSLSASLIPLVIAVFCIYAIWNGNWETDEAKQERIEQLIADDSKADEDRNSVIKGTFGSEDIPIEMSLTLRENVVRGTFKVGNKSGKMKAIEIPLSSGEVVNWEMYAQGTDVILATISGNLKFTEDRGCKSIIGLDGFISFAQANDEFSAPIDIHLAINGNANDEYTSNNSPATFEQNDDEVEETVSEQQNDVDNSLENEDNKVSVEGQGLYVFASERLLTEEDIAGLSAYDLKIMRNEIFARHGYIFKTKDMKEYFNAQSWYTPRASDVTSQLSPIEIKNIAFIKSHE